MDKFRVEIKTTAAKSEVEHWYELYLNVKSHNLGLNTFDLPKKLFYQLLENRNWEVLTLSLKDHQEPEAIVFCYKTEYCYIPMIIGMNYTFNKEFHVYRQALYQIVERAFTLNKEKIYFGFSASLEKKKMGAVASPVFGYMHIKDSYNHQVLSEINSIAELVYNV